MNIEIMRFHPLYLLGLLFIILGLGGLGFSNWETTSTIKEEITHTETYIDYETRTKTIIERKEVSETIIDTKIVKRKSTKIYPDERPNQPLNRPFRAGFPFTLNPKCNNYHLVVEASNEIFSIMILTPDAYKTVIENPDFFAIFYFKFWHEEKKIDEVLNLSPRDYVLYFSAGSNSAEISFEITQDCEKVVTKIVETPKEVTETVPVEKTREVTDTVEKEILEKPYKEVFIPSIIFIIFGGGLIFLQIVQYRKSQKKKE